jgi:hypothetical protein
LEYKFLVVSENLNAPKKISSPHSKPKILSKQLEKEVTKTIAESKKKVFMMFFFIVFKFISEKKSL